MTSRLTGDQSLSKNLWEGEIHTSLYPEKSAEGISPSTPRGYTATGEQLL